MVYTHLLFLFRVIIYENLRLHIDAYVIFLWFIVVIIIVWVKGCCTVHSLYAWLSGAQDIRFLGLPESENWGFWIIYYMVATLLVCIWAIFVYIYDLSHAYLAIWDGMAMRRTLRIRLELYVDSCWTYWSYDIRRLWSNYIDWMLSDIGTYKMVVRTDLPKFSIAVIICWPTAGVAGIDLPVIVYIVIIESNFVMTYDLSLDPSTVIGQWQVTISSNASTIGSRTTIVKIQVSTQLLVISGDVLAWTVGTLVGFLGC